MATVTACSRSLVLACGEKVALLDFSCPEEVVLLNLPETRNAAPQSKSHDGKKALKQAGSEHHEESKNAGDKPSLSDRGPETNRILAADVSGDGQYLALCDDHKYLHAYQRQGGGSKQWTLVSSRCVSRRCSTVRFDSKRSLVLVADKSGDVFSFPIHPADPTSSPSETSATNDPEVVGGQGQGDSKEAAQTETFPEAGEDSADGQLLLGHLSMLLDMIVLEQEDLVVTSDRDEKIRVSRYPDSYNIHSYCLGHSAFVISLARDSERHLLFSGSGDCTICVWDYLQGKLLTQRSCLEDVESPMHLDDPTSGKEGTQGEITSANPSLDPDTACQPSVEQIAYCQQCCLLFVVMHRSTEVLVYQVVFTTDDHNEVPTLVTHPPVKGQGEVVSACVQGCVLWCVREKDGQSGSGLVATRIERSEDGFQMVNLTAEGDCCESKILRTMEKHTDFFKGAPARQDLTILRKSHVDGYVDQYLERKRQRVEGKGGGAANAGQSRNGEVKHKRS